MRGEIARIVERAPGVGFLRDADQIEYRKRCHGETLGEPLSGDEGGQLPAEGNQVGSSMDRPNDQTAKSSFYAQPQ
jgi:hypothetical protein